MLRQYRRSKEGEEKGKEEVKKKVEGR